VADDQSSAGSPPEPRPGAGGQPDRQEADPPGAQRPDPPRAGRADPPGAAGAGPAGEPGPLLADLDRLRRQTRAARHAYWFPLILFGLLTCGAAPLYVAAAPAPPVGVVTVPLLRVPALLNGLPISMSTFYVGWYWAVALVGGYLLTLAWYRWHARRAGVRTPARGYLITGVALTAAVVVIPPLTRWVPGLALIWLPFGDVWIRGTLAFLIIATGLWVLARAERSRVLALIALVYTGAALLVSLYNVENVVFRLGWNPGGSALAWRLTVLPNVLLPAVVLLVAGCGAFLAQRGRRSTA
jgi:hypothetical protein